MTKLEHALALAAKGFKVFPIAAGAKKPPLLLGWPKRASSKEDEVRAFWSAVPDANIGIHCEGLVVIDVDVKNGGNDAIEFLRMSVDLPATLATITPSGGHHLFYRLPDGHAGVPNSASKLGPGLDIRSAGGYVVAPGSQVDAGVYAFEFESVAIADTPVWLLDKLGQAVQKLASTDAVPPATDPALERARVWLAGQLPAYEGQGGDARTFAVACGLRDQGISEAQAVELLTHWNALCVPPWSAAELAVKARNAYAYGQNEPGAKTATADDFPAVPAAPGAPVAPESSSVLPSTPRSTALRLVDFAAREAKGPGYVVKGLLERRSYAELYGAPGEGKTFVALDLAYHVAAGRIWHDRKVHAGLVLYLAYEGTGGLVKRTQALRQHYGKADVPLYVAAATFNLRDLTGRRDLGALMATLPTKPVLIVIDTFAHALMGGDENSAQDVGAFNTAVVDLIQNTGSCVLIVHHSGKNKAAGARGSSALQAAIDTELEIDSGQILSRKQRDVEIAPPIGFILIPLVVGLDEDGDEVTSCVVSPISTVAVPAARLTGNAKRGYEALCAIAKDNHPVSPTDWRTACEEFLGARPRQGFYDLKKALLRKSVVVENAQGMITRRFE